jgi:redox-sensitive bicupin YhaK (pirin superfamily)
MLTLRPANARGHANHGWLDSHHTFSFASYYDPDHMGFRALRVINEDRVRPGQGFGSHSHRDMEIISYVLEGALRHDDSTGRGEVIRRGDVQRMSAGSGVTHSEFNASRSEPVHFLQIWLEPERKGIPPSYEQRSFAEAQRQGRLLLVASRDGREGSVTIHADVSMYAGLLAAGQTAELPLGTGRCAWVQIAAGRARVNGNEMGPGDGAALEAERAVVLEGLEQADVLVFDLA